MADGAVARARCTRASLASDVMVGAVVVDEGRRAHVQSALGVQQNRGSKRREAQGDPGREEHEYTGLTDVLHGGVDVFDREGRFY